MVIGNVCWRRFIIYQIAFRGVKCFDIINRKVLNWHWSPEKSDSCLKCQNLVEIQVNFDL